MELKILHIIQNLHTDFLDRIMIFFTNLGDAGFIWIIIALILLINKKHRKCGIMLVISLILSLIIGNIFLKNIIARQRPCWIDDTVNLLVNNPSDFSFPSGHTLSSFACAVSIYLYNKKNGKYAVALATIIAFSRLYLFVHFPTDVFAGIIFGIIIAFLSRYMYNVKYEKKLINT